MSITLLLAGILTLNGCSAKKPRPWIDIADINEQITRDADKPAVIDAGKEEDVSDQGTGTKVRDMSVQGDAKNTYLQALKKSTKNGPIDVAGDEGIQLNFDNADIYEVIQVITETLKMNYIVDPSVKGVVNIRSGEKISRTKLYEVFQKILNMNGLNIRSEGDYYYIYPAKQASTLTIYSPEQVGRLKESPRMVIQIMPIMHISANMAVKLIEPYLSDHGKVDLLPDQNTLIIADFESKIIDALLVLAKIDVSPLANLKVRLVRVDKAPLFTLRDELVEILNALRVNQKDHEGVTVLPLERVNSLLLVSSNDSILDSAGKWVAELDVMPSEGRDNIYIYNVRNSVASDLAGLVNDLISGKNSSSSTTKSTTPKTTTDPKSGTATKTGITTKPRTPSPGVPGLGSADLGFAGEPILLPDDSRNIILLRALPPDYNRLVKLLERLDTIPRQVLVEVMVAEVKLSNSWELGVEWYFKEQNRMKINNGTYSNQYNFSALGEAKDFTYNVFNSAEDLVGALEIIATDNDFSVLSSPQIMVLNNETATINVGDQIPIITSTSIPQGETDYTSQTVQYKDTGVMLTVTPRINYNGIIILEIEQEVSDASGAGTATIISSRQLKTKLAVKDGNAVMMGGLMKKTTDKAEHGVPFLKDIPLLGWLFKYQKEEVINTELLVMITPYVIDSENVLDQYLQKFQEKTNELRKSLKGDKSQQDAADSN
jgi:general secretion pathway protein D